ncbi:4-hydroxybenzoate synthetase (chorismate-pyruvate lyase) [Amycolatopsis sacchari]|uniref:4-hydroxybenzoate synthetase (Chorismate-pyruvate lyase) n=1 Tax=Amycolatopsis sacchari TaxID=115433 RepID=A0A1I3MVL2_9PSEU|nr:hypothetical protein [Amycolatopsis sacchari]SFJ00989.1 4-hydroxybenzoate synthetase (chorismate-pyruvate lyase) [Amycolatopsis sacchari]
MTSTRIPVDFPDGEFTVRNQADIAAAIARFRCSSTRGLLGGRGLTTTSLVAMADGPLRVLREVRDQVPASRVPREILDVLGKEPLLVRCSALVGPGERVWSVNQVVARADVPEPVRQSLTGGAPVGAALRSVGIAHSRTLMAVGRRPWPLGSGPAAFRAYVLWHAARPLAVVCETFNPEVVDAAYARSEVAG